jgi:hypothetical protein
MAGSLFTPPVYQTFERITEGSPSSSIGRLEEVIEVKERRLG